MKAKVKLAKRSSQVALISLLLIILSLILNVPHARASGYGGWDEDIGTSNPDWMRNKVLDNHYLNEISIPGTHDSFAWWGTIWHKTQSRSIAEQLDAGIRALDIRVRHERNIKGEDRFHLFHTDYYYGDFDGVLEACTTFLSNSKSTGETIIMRLGTAGCNHPRGGPVNTFEETFQSYLDKSAAGNPNKCNKEFIWGYEEDWWKEKIVLVDGEEINIPSIPTMKEVRGKIVILQETSGVCEEIVFRPLPEECGLVHLEWTRYYGIPWNHHDYFAIQPYYNFDGQLGGDLANNILWKWEKIKRYLERATKLDHYDEIYVNCLNGAGIEACPWEVASGHKDFPPSNIGSNGAHCTIPESHYGNLPEKYAYIHQHLVDFKRDSKDRVILEGTNEMCYKYLKGYLPIKYDIPNRTGIIMMDFPGPELILCIINLNPLNRPPNADAGGSYEGAEGSCMQGSGITLNAGKSTDADGDSLTYSWDLDDDGEYDDATGVTTKYTRNDNGEYTVGLKVSDGDHADTDTATVRLWDLAPTAAFSSDSPQNEGSAMSFTDESTSCPDEIATWAWTFGDDDSSSSDQNPTHTYANNGDYTVSLTVTDDDDNASTCETSVIVNNVEPTAHIVSMEQPNPHFILPIVHTLTFTGTFTDPGWLDTHTTNWDFGDESNDPGTTIEENEQPDATGTTSAEHAYSEPGTYTVTLAVTDDDEETGTTTWEVTVLTAEEATAVINDNIQACPDEAFKNNPDQKKHTFAKKLDAAIKQISEGAYQEAIDRLRDDVKAKVDGPLGCGPRHDWITDLGVQADLCMMIQDTIDYLETLL